jgi:uncharacterized SAM-binding protein YcdF (DUF218 family)
MREPGGGGSGTQHDKIGDWVHLTDRRKRGSRRFKLLILSGLFAFSMVAGWMVKRVVFPRIGYSLICSDIPRQADLILVLGGDFWRPRVFKAADLAVQGFAPLVLISGPPYGEEGRPEGEFAIESLTAHGYPREFFAVFGHRARSTVEEAIALAPELRRRRVKSVILVTSAYHSRRADIVMRLFCDNGITFISIPASDKVYIPDQWWDDPGSRKMFFSEWSKIIGSVLVAYPKYRLTGWRQP